MRGLITLCRGNPKIRKHRIVDVWQTVLPVVDLVRDIVGQTCLRRGHVTGDVAAWLTEAETLLDLGMPRESFELTLHAGSLAEHASNLFELVLKDGAEQFAMDHC